MGGRGGKAGAGREGKGEDNSENYGRAIWVRAGHSSEALDHPARRHRSQRRPGRGPETEESGRQPAAFSADSRSPAAQPARGGGKPSARRGGTASQPGPAPGRLRLPSSRTRLRPRPRGASPASPPRLKVPGPRPPAAALEPAAYRRRAGPAREFPGSRPHPPGFPPPATHKPHFLLQASAAAGFEPPKRGEGASITPPPAAGPSPPPPPRSPENPCASPEGTRSTSASSASGAGGRGRPSSSGPTRLFPCAAAAHSALGGAGWLPGCGSSVRGGCCCLWPGRLGEAECW